MIDRHGEAERTFVAGWAGRRQRVWGPGAILDVGSGAFPNRAADFLFDGELTDDVHRHGEALVIDRPLVVGRAEQMPFRDQGVLFAIASHIAEHVEDPDSFCQELKRIARSGYIETPSPLADILMDESYHLWRVKRRDGVLVFTRKKQRGPLAERLGRVTYNLCTIGQEGCAGQTWRVPDGPIRRVVSAIRYVVMGTMARARLLHTTYQFGVDRPLHWRVVR